MTASPWVRRWSHLLSPQSSVLDIACGQGRHMQWFCSRGHKVTGIDRSDSALAEASAWGQTVQADIEHAPWPLMDGDLPRQFGAVVVTNYLWRPLLELVRQSIAPGGVLIYETFAAGNESVGKPSRPDFLLQPGELLRAFDGLRTVAYEDGFLEAPSRYIQRLVAVRAPASSAPDTQPPRYLL
jgi:SAM-dependent methyltransferase